MTVALTLVAGTARAEAPAIAADTVVRLRSGAVYQGELVERVPGDHVTLRLVTGEIKRFADSDVTRVEDLRGAGRAEREPAPRPVYVELASPRPDVELVRLTTTTGALDGNLNGSLTGSTAGEKVCLAPCRLTVAPGQFILGGPGLRQSARFELTGRTPRVRISVAPGTESRLTTGIVLGGAGALSAMVGTALLPVAFIQHAQDDPGFGRDPPRTRLPDGLLPVALILMGVGVVMGIAGLSMAATSQTTFELGPAP